MYDCQELIDRLYIRCLQETDPVLFDLMSKAAYTIEELYREFPFASRVEFEKKEEASSAEKSEGPRCWWMRSPNPAWKVRERKEVSTANMRAIYAEPIEKFIEDGLNNPNRELAFGHDAVEILTEIFYAPTLTVREDEAYWEKSYDEDEMYEFFRCSKCKEEAHRDEKGDFILSKYCPECGSKMKIN